MNKWLACCLVLVTSGCPDIQTDPNEGPGPLVEFDPGNKIVPFPNNLLLNPSGKVNIPPACNEGAAAKALREGVLNKLDGFGTFETAMSVTFTAEVDPATAAESIVLYKRAPAGGDSVDPATSMPIPIVVFPGKSVRFANQTANADGTLTCDSPGEVNSLTIVPRVPLEQRTTYVVAVTSGLKTVSGEDYAPSSTWAIIRQGENPVTLDANNNIVSERTPLDPSNAADRAQLLGIDLLWKAHARGLAFLEAKQHAREDVLLAWEFNTQTTTDPLDPAVASVPAAMLNDVAVTGPNDQVPVPISLTAVANLPASRAALPFSVCNTGAGLTAPPEPNDVQCFLKISLGGGTGCAADATGATCQMVFAVGTATCALVGCANVGDVLAGRVLSPQFQLNLPNTVDAASGGGPIPGPWADPIKPAKVEDEQLQALIMIPTGAAPANGWPTVVFQHGLGSSRTNLFAIGDNLARDPDGVGNPGTGFASISIDAVAHGSRLVRISNTGDCAMPTSAKCFAGFLSPDLGSTRDNIRQTVIDQQQVITSIKKCAGTTCGTFEVDPAHIVYGGLSLGGIIGSVTAAVQPDIKASLLNVPGVGWVDIFENTETLDIRCQLVDGLIDAGIVTGAKRDTKGTVDPSDDTGLCVGQDWKTQPGYRQFSAIARWVLDPADPANFARKLATKKKLIQEVVGDTVVPNVATANEGALNGLTPTAADPVASLTPTPSAAITTMPTASKWVRYMNLAPTATPPFPGNTYAHSSLLRPAPSVTNPTAQCNTSTGANCDGVFGTIRMVTDAIAFLQINK